LYDVRYGKINSCGCIHKKQLADRNKANAKHGYFGTPTYISWSGIIERCCNPKSGNFDAYGEKGILMCERWRTSFENFLEDMGERPPGTSIDRIDVFGNYEPHNCRWADAKTQARNRSNNVRYEYDGKNLTLAEWSEITGIKADTINRRIKKLGWPANEALTRKVK
jgi:Fic family protein